MIGISSWTNIAQLGRGVKKAFRKKVPLRARLLILVMFDLLGCQGGAKKRKDEGSSMNVTRVSLFRILLEYVHIYGSVHIKRG